MFKFGIICGGPSLERGISLNSARSILDHCNDFGFDIGVIFVDQQCKFYEISPSQLYSNTPSDFDFKLISSGVPISNIEVYLKDFDLVFPAIHGKFGESGTLQVLLEKINVPFVGTSSAACSVLFDKYKAKQTLLSRGFKVPDGVRIEKDENFVSKVAAFLDLHPKVVVKPVASGSSIGVNVVESFEEACCIINQLFNDKIDDALLLEEYCTGREFTILVLEVDNNPVALVPTEIETSYQDNAIFDYRKKYLPTHNTLYHTPPKHFSIEVIENIRRQAERVFKIFAMQDVSRMDGWVDHNGNIMFTDFNPISGMEQNSFLFRQSSLVGLSHSDTLEFIMSSALSKRGMKLPNKVERNKKAKYDVFVLFGGKTPERQVSLMSGTNVWLKLLKSQIFNPIPMMLDKNGSIWSLPYSYCLNHTVEEIAENCEHSKDINHKLNVLLQIIHKQCPALACVSGDIAVKYNLIEFLALVKKHSVDFVFLALHGGDGEDGTIQQTLEQNQIAFNGSGSIASAICMDKYRTGEVINKLALVDLYSLKKYVLSPGKLRCIGDVEKLWREITSFLMADYLIIKPKSEGCSAGIVKLQSAADLQKYINLLHDKAMLIPANSFQDQHQMIELPENIEQDYIIEEYIQVDKIKVDCGKLFYTPQNGWIELTIGVTESRGIYHALSPSITIAEGAVLSLEEKFQGGTGINITPPPSEIISSAQIGFIKHKIEVICSELSIENYARIDIFFNVLTNKLIVIEINSLPALTPSTVIFHQALAETVSIAPRVFLENLILSKIGALIYDKISL
jgi:D-alanine--D-alanine ligase